jgi:thiosulfate/3-mercaptopyruvate sulfurtransferase
MQYTHPEYLVTPSQLHEQLGDPNLRVFDTAVFLIPGKHGYAVETGHKKYREAHLPGAGFIDLNGAWADPTSDLNFTVPNVDSLANAIGKVGIGNDHRVVLYSSSHLMWATRAWWLLHYAGHKNVAILNGNLNAWRDAGLPVESGEQHYASTQFMPTVDAGCIASTTEVEDGMHGSVCTINALSRSLYEGTGDFYYQRRGHIPGSKLLYYDAVLTDETFLEPDSLRAALSEHGMLDAERVITYCGGGIAATVDAFACKLLGHGNVGVYDGSMSAWVTDDARPLTVGPTP